MPFKKSLKLFVCSDNQVSSPLMSTVMNLALITGLLFHITACTPHTYAYYTHQTDIIFSQTLLSTDWTIPTRNHSPRPTPLSGADCICLFKRDTLSICVCACVIGSMRSCCLTAQCITVSGDRPPCTVSTDANADARQVPNRGWPRSISSDVLSNEARCLIPFFSHPLPSFFT